MKTEDIFKRSYFKSLGLICEEEETKDTADTPEVELKKVTFYTSDDALVDALNSGFEEVVIFTNAKDEETGEDTVVEVKFGKDSFGNVTIEETEEVTECGDTDPVSECGDQEITEEDAEEDFIEVDDEKSEDAEGLTECCEKCGQSIKKVSSKYGY